MSAKRSLSRTASNRSCSAIESANGGRARDTRRGVVALCRLRSRYTKPRFSAKARHALFKPTWEASSATASITRPRCCRPPSAAPEQRTVFLGIDDQFGAPELVAQPSVVALQLLNLSGRSIRLWPTLFWRQRHLIGPADLVAPGRDHRGVDALAAQECPERTGLLAPLGLGEQPPLLASGELAPPSDRHDLRIMTRRFRRDRLSSRPAGSFRDGLAGRPSQFFQRRLQR